MSNKKDKDFEHKEEKHKGCGCKHCVCEVLADILAAQEKNRSSLPDHCSLQPRQNNTGEVIPFILQTPHGNPFFTWGKIGTADCFVTVFFYVVKVDCEENCAVLGLFKPNESIIDPETECVETGCICNVDFLIPTKECVVVDLNCFSAVKCLSLDIVKKHA